MCPACYLNGFLFLLFGAAGATIANNPWIIAIAVILTLAGFYWMWKAWKRRSPGTFKKNLKTTVTFLLVFAAGFITASYMTCLLYTSPSPRDMRRPRMPSSA